jgi:hypothetical protein
LELLYIDESQLWLLAVNPFDHIIRFMTNRMFIPILHIGSDIHILSQRHNQTLRNLIFLHCSISIFLWIKVNSLKILA